MNSLNPPSISSREFFENEKMIGKNIFSSILIILAQSKYIYIDALKILQRLGQFEGMQKIAQK